MLPDPSVAAKYIEDLELPDAPLALTQLPPEPARVVRDGEEHSYVDSGSVVSFVSGVSAQHQSDVLNSTLLAQLAATKMADREKETAAWYDKYREVLMYCGWVTQAFDFQKFTASGSEFYAQDVVLKILAAIASGNEVAAVMAAIDAVKQLPSDSRGSRIWSTNANTTQAGNFQIAAAVESGNVVAMKMGAFTFDSTVQVTQVLWMTFKSNSTNFYQSGQVATLDEDVYARVRKLVTDKLGDRAAQYIADLEI